MEVLLEDGVILKKVVGAVVDLVPSACLEFGRQGLHFRAIDPSHVAMVDVQLEPTLWEKWVVPPGDLPVNLGVNLAALRKVLGMVSPGDQLRLKWDPARDNILNVQFANVAKKRNYDIDIRLMDIEVDQLEIPDMEYTHMVRLPSADFYQCVGDCSQFGDTAGLALGGTKLVTSVEGDEAKTFMSLEGEGDGPTPGGPPLSMKFALRYLLAFAKARDVDPQVTLKMLAGMPLCVQFAVGGGHGTVAYYLAPKVSDEEAS
jgi:proliferating cell nuclear antigen